MAIKRSIDRRQSRESVRQLRYGRSVVIRLDKPVASRRVGESGRDKVVVSYRIGKTGRS